VTFLEQIKHTGILPDTHKTHDHLNEQKYLPVKDSIVTRWRRESEGLAKEHQEKYGERLVWAIADGFLMYWNKVEYLFRFFYS
jgi:nicotinamide/nicotinate riboside kinase